MNQYLCCLHDIKSDTYYGFALFPNIANAIRSFQAACEKDETFKRWPEDFEFILIAKIEQVPGEINEKNEVVKATVLKEPKFYSNQVIAKAVDYVAIAKAKNEKNTK